MMMGAGLKIFFNRVVARLIEREGDPAVADKAQAEEMPPLYAYLETIMPENGWLVADEPTIGDIAVISPLVNMSYCGAAPDPATYPKLTAYIARWMERPSLKPWVERERAFLQSKLK